MIINPYRYAADPIKAIFAGGYVGNYIDFRDLSTLYQDTAGTTPCTTVGQTVGSARCKQTGSLVVLQAGITATLAQVSGVYCVHQATTTSTTQCAYLGSGIVPSGLGGDCAFSIIEKADFASGVAGQPLYVGPASIGTGNALSLGNVTTQSAAQVFTGGTGRASSSTLPYFNGLVSVLGTMTASVSGSKTCGIYQGNTTNTASPSTCTGPTNVTTMDLRLGRAVTAASGKNMYVCAIINKVISMTEWAAILAKL